MSRNDDATQLGVKEGPLRKAMRQGVGPGAPAWEGLFHQQLTTEVQRALAAFPGLVCWVN